VVALAAWALVQVQRVFLEVQVAALVKVLQLQVQHLADREHAVKVIQGATAFSVLHLEQWEGLVVELVEPVLPTLEGLDLKAVPAYCGLILTSHTLAAAAYEAGQTPLAVAEVLLHHLMAHQV